jgi:hypothetical protein
MTSRELYAVAVKIDRMRQIEKSVRRINAYECNYELPVKQEKRRENLEAEYATIAASFGLFAECQRDPRGAALKLHDSREGMDSATGVML